MSAPPDAFAPRPQLRAVVFEELLDGGAVPPSRYQADGRAAPPGVDGVRGIVLFCIVVRLREVLTFLWDYAAIMWRFTIYYTAIILPTHCVLS